MSLSEKTCEPCHRADIKPLSLAQAKEYLKEIADWELGEDDAMISRRFKFSDFIDTMEFVNKVAALAEAEGHHPDLHIFYDHVDVDLWTHSVQGLTENDFILAAKINLL